MTFVKSSGLKCNETALFSLFHCPLGNLSQTGIPLKDTGCKRDNKNTIDSPAELRLQPTEAYRGYDCVATGFKIRFFKRG